MGMQDNSPPPHCGGGNGVDGVTGAFAAAFSWASRALLSFSFKEKIATDRARFIKLCFTLVFFAANSSAAKIGQKKLMFLLGFTNMKNFDFKHFLSI